MLWKDIVLPLRGPRNSRSRVLALIVYQASPRDPLVLAGVVLAMSLLGLLAKWIPARRALSIDPLVLLREE
jgi:ABC-type lipoprotein release transport system permease subunit